MAKSLTEFQCAKHRHPQPLQGVCPSCLREKLSHLRFNSNREIAKEAPSCSSSISYSPASSSPDRRERHHREKSEMAGSVSYMLSSRSLNLRKSRSIANFTQYGSGEKKKAGFWSKLLGFKGKKEIRSDLFGDCKREVSFQF